MIRRGCGAPCESVQSESIQSLSHYRSTTLAWLNGIHSHTYLQRKAAVGSPLLLVPCYPLEDLPRSKQEHYRYATEA